MRGEVDTAGMDDSLKKFVAKGCVKEKRFYCHCHLLLFLTEDTRAWFEY